jgi:hypothetical protein
MCTLEITVEKLFDIMPSLIIATRQQKASSLNLYINTETGNMRIATCESILDDKFIKLCDLSCLSPDICPLHSENNAFLNSSEYKKTMHFYVICLIADIVLNVKNVISLKIQS